MRFRLLIVLDFILLSLAACAGTAPSTAQGVNPAPMAAVALPTTVGYLDPASLDLYRLLPPPPEARSAQERAELDELLRIQAARSPAEAKRASDDATISIFRFADALGSPPRFSASQLPLTAALFDRIGHDETEFLDGAKDKFARPRPFLSEPGLHPVIARPTSKSYPSGHTTWAITCAIVLADMIPERRPELFARADEFAHNREVAGVHYPSDVAAGHLAGAALAAQLFHAPRFVADEAAATIELRQALGLPPKR